MTKEERSAYNKKHYADHKEEKRKYDKKYYANPEVQKRIVKRRKKYNEEHREELNATSRDNYHKGRKAGTVMICWITERYEGIPCVDCDHIFSWECMDFDHRPEETKSFSIGSKGGLKTTPERIAEVMKEISKCDLVCSNCHRTRTKERKRS
jgi:hypothetical protein